MAPKFGKFGAGGWAQFGGDFLAQGNLAASIAKDSRDDFSCRNGGSGKQQRAVQSRFGTYLDIGLNHGFPSHDGRGIDQGLGRFPGRQILSGKLGEDLAGEVLRGSAVGPTVAGTRFLDAHREVRAVPQVLDGPGSARRPGKDAAAVKGYAAEGAAGAAVGLFGAEAVAPDAHEAALAHQHGVDARMVEHQERNVGVAFQMFAPEFLQIEVVEDVAIVNQDVVGGEAAGRKGFAQGAAAI